MCWAQMPRDFGIVLGWQQLAVSALCIIYDGHTYVLTGCTLISGVSGYRLFVVVVIYNLTNVYPLSVLRN